MTRLPWAVLPASGLLVLFAAELLAGPAPVAPWRTSIIVPTSSAIAPPDTARWSSVILARPLFRASRRPVPVVAANAAANAPLPRLSAIVITAAGRSAIFIGTDGTVSVVAQGGRIGAYQVASILPDQLHLVGPTGALTLRPQFSSNPASSGPPPPAAAPAPLSGLPSFRFPDGPL